MGYISGIEYRCHKENNMNRKVTTKVSQARKHGSSIALSMTGFINEGDFYMIERSGEQVILTPIEISEKK